MSEYLYALNQRVRHAPTIKKTGIISPGMEQTPIVLNDEIILVESHIENQLQGEARPCIRLRNFKTGWVSKTFGHGYYFASGYFEDGVVYAFGTSKLDDKPLTMYKSEDRSSWHDPRGGDEVCMFWSNDLEKWNKKTILKVPGWRLWNTSVCKGENGYVMAIEVRQLGDKLDPVIGHPFTTFFAKSANLFNWEMMPYVCCYTRERYNACPTLRYSDGWYYMICLEALPAARYAPYIYRTKNFIDWEVGFHNPMMMFDDNDRVIHEETSYIFSEDEIDKLKNWLNINNSDVDLCEYNGKTHIFYATGDQMNYSFLGEAVYEGLLDQFLKAYFE